jgi:hypothetical protein
MRKYNFKRFKFQLKICKVFQKKKKRTKQHIQGDSYIIIQTLTGGRFQPLDALTKMSRF